MSFSRRLIAFLWLAFASSPVFAVAVQAALNQDGSFNTKYRAGNKPIAPTATCPVGWTCAVKGTGAGQVDEISSTAFEIVTAGTDDEGDIVYAYKTCSTGDCEVVAEVPAPSNWVGHQEPYTSFLVGFSDSTSSSAWFWQAWVTPDGRPRCKGGTPGPNDYTALLEPVPFPIKIAVTRDASENDYGCWRFDATSGWVRYGTFSHTPAGAYIGYVGGTSHNVDASTTTTLSSISHTQALSIYEPNPPPPPPPGNTAPFCTGIPNVNYVVGVQITALDLALYCDDNDVGDSVVSYSATGLTSRGLTLEPSTGMITGTPTVAASFTSQVSVLDTHGAAGTASFNITITVSNGAVITFTPVANDTASFNCANVANCKPGATIQIPGGTYMNARLSFSNMIGAANNPIIVKNRASDSSPVILESPSGRPRFGIECDNCEYVTFDFLGGWNGKAAGLCGVVDNPDGVLNNGEEEIDEQWDGCGLIYYGGDQDADSVYGLGNAGGVPQDVYNRKGRAAFVTIQGMYGIGDFDGNQDAATQSHMFNMNDSARCLDDLPAGKDWVEGITIRKFIAKDFNSTAGYIGPNVNKPCNSKPTIKGNLEHQRNIIIEYGVIQRDGEGGIKIKNVPGSDPRSAIFRYMHVRECGDSPLPSSEGANNQCITLHDSSGSAYNNVLQHVQVDTPDGEAINCNTDHSPLQPSGVWGSRQVCHIYNNVIWDTQGDGIACYRSRTGAFGVNRGQDCRVEFNTIVDPANSSGVCIDANKGSEDGSTAGDGSVRALGYVRNNICADNTAADRAVTTGTQQSEQNNLETDIAGADFVNAGAGNFKLNAGSPAVNTGTAGPCVANDVYNVTRPQGGACDKGAHER